MGLYRVIRIRTLLIRMRFRIMTQKIPASLYMQLQGMQVQMK